MAWHRPDHNNWEFGWHADNFDDREFRPMKGHAPDQKYIPGRWFPAECVYA